MSSEEGRESSWFAAGAGEGADGCNDEPGDFGEDGGGEDVFLGGVEGEDAEGGEDEGDAGEKQGEGEDPDEAVEDAAEEGEALALDIEFALLELALVTGGEGGLLDLRFELLVFEGELLQLQVCLADALL